MKADFVVTEDKHEVVKAAWDSYLKSPASLSISTMNKAFEVGFKTGFLFALIALEEGALGAIKEPKQAGDNE